MGLEDYEVVEEEYGPAEQHTLPSANKKLKMTHDGSKKKVKNTPRAPRNQDLNLTMYKRDFGVNRVPICNPKKRKRVSVSSFAHHV